MKLVLQKILCFSISTFLVGLLVAAPAAAQSAYITPTDTGGNFDYMVVPGSIVWFGGLLFYFIGKYLTAKFAAISQ